MLTGAEREIYARRRRRTLGWLAAAGALTVIVVALYRAEPRIPYFRELFVFSAPGAVLGLAVSWAVHVFRQRSFTWRTGLTGAGLGALLLPPVLAAVTVPSVSASPDAALRLFVMGEWTALAPAWPLCSCSHCRGSSAGRCVGPVPASRRELPPRRESACGFAGAVVLSVMPVRRGRGTLGRLVRE